MRLLKRYKAIARVSNMYGILQYLFLTNNKLEDTMFIFTPGFGFSDKRVLNNIPIHPYFRGETNLIKRRCQALYIHLYAFLFPRTDIYLSGNLFLTDLLTDLFTNVYVLEDGAENYRKREWAPEKRDFYHGWLYGRCACCMGLSEKVKKIFLSGILPIPENIRHKVEIFNISDLWEAKSTEERKQINSLFLPENLNLDMIRSRNILLLTQPISQTSTKITETDKINIYKAMVAPYDEKQLVIKTHPRETTDYRLYFPEAYVITDIFPMELFSLNFPNTFKVALTIDSTAIHSLGNDVEKIFNDFKYL